MLGAEGRGRGFLRHWIFRSSRENVISRRGWRRGRGSGRRLGLTLGQPDRDRTVPASSVDLPAQQRRRPDGEDGGHCIAVEISDAALIEGCLAVPDVDLSVPRVAPDLVTKGRGSKDLGVVLGREFLTELSSGGVPHDDVSVISRRPH